MEYMSPGFDDLIRKGRIRGYITYTELNQVLPDDAVKPDVLDQVLSHLEQLGIEVREEPTESASS